MDQSIAPSAFDLKTLLCLVTEREWARLQLIAQRAAMLALGDASVTNMSVSNRQIVVCATQGEFTGGLTVHGERYLSARFNDERLARLVEGHFLAKAEEAIRTEESHRWGAHSGAVTAWQVMLDKLWNAIYQRQRGMFNDTIGLRSIVAYCWALIAGRIDDAEFVEGHVEALQRECFADNLRAELLAKCPGEYAEIAPTDPAAEPAGRSRRDGRAPLKGPSMSYQGLIPHLSHLDTQPSWRYSELPPQITKSVLRELDRFKLIEVCLWGRFDIGGRPMDKPGRQTQYGRSGWFVVGDNSRIAGTLDEVLDHPMYQGELQPEFRVSPTGAEWLRGAEQQRQTKRVGRRRKQERQGLNDPITVVSVVKVVGRKAGRSDKLADKMKRRNYPVEKIAGKWSCQRADAIAMFPHHKLRIEEI